MMMTKREVMLLMVACGAVGAVISGRVTAGVGSTAAVRTALAAVGPADGTSSYSYVGSKQCKKCHIKEHRSWAKTKMGLAFEILKPGQSEEARKKFNLDVSKDYTKDETCLKCHTVGFGKPGGYAIPDPDDKKAVRRAKKLESIGCECCHGAGGEYVKVFAEIQKSKRKYKVEELYAVGLVKIDKSTCLTCHNEESPTIEPSDPFDFEKRKSEGTHEHHPLKQREE